MSTRKRSTANRSTARGSDAADSPAPLVERTLAVASFTVIVVAVLSYFATLIVGMNDREALTGGLWPFMTWMAFVGVPVGFLLLFTLLGLNMARRSREQKQRGGTVANPKRTQSPQKRQKR